MMDTSIIRTYNLSKNYNGTHALKDINVELNKGEITALVGANGAGKSTFVKLLYGEIQPTKGYIEINGQRIKFSSPKKAIEHGVVKISQDFDLFDELSIAENIFMYHTKDNNSKLYQKDHANKFALNSLSLLKYEIDINRKIKELNVTEKQIISIAKAISRNPKILILDEPTSVLNSIETSTLFYILKEIKNLGTSVIFISHKLEEVLEISDRIFVLRDGIVTLNSETSKITRDDIFFSMLGHKESLKINIKESEDITSSTFLKFVNCSGKKFHNISFEIGKSETLGLISDNRQSIINIVETIYGLQKLRTGQIELNKIPEVINSPIYAISKGIGYLPEDRRNEGLFYNLGLVDNMSIALKKKESILGIISKNQILKKLKLISDKLKIVSSSMNQPISEISGGNQQKSLFARWYICDIQLFILIEPTAGVDISSRMEIYNMIDDLKKESKSFLVVSSDRQELVQICDRIIKVTDGEIVGIFNKSQYSNDENILN
jgi:ribose transport system ATP-binding protein